MTEEADLEKRDARIRDLERDLAARDRRLADLQSRVDDLQAQSAQRSAWAFGIIDRLVRLTVELASDRAESPARAPAGIDAPSEISQSPSAQRILAADRDEPTIPTAELSAQAATYRAMLAATLGNGSSEYVPHAEKSDAGKRPPVKLFAFYLPQFHPIPENDRWWGRGFTEWTNVSRAVPQFVGHYQPHLPGELGFYDLRVPEVQRRQVELARNYGVCGFCFYYYWFAGKRLLDRPLIQFSSDPAIDFPFCLCWANENWTRRWDGQDGDILIAQDHSEQTDVAFVKDIEPFLRHKNYLRINDRPVLIVYRARLLPDPAATARRWREHCQKAGIGNPYLIAAQAFEEIDPREIGFDAAVEFPPNTAVPRTQIARELPLSNPEYSGQNLRYSDLVNQTFRRARPLYELFRTVCPGWDNEPRRPGRGTTYAFSSPKAYGRWLDDACRFALAEPDPEKRVVFINAWNEWAEGAHLEPDQRYGYAYLQTTSDVVYSLSADGR